MYVCLIVFHLSVYRISLGYELHILLCQHYNTFYFLRRFLPVQKASSSSMCECESFITDTHLHQNTAHLVTISTFFKELGTWSATTRTADYTFTYSHFMHTNFHRLKQGKNQILLSPRLLGQQECSWTAHPSDLESLPTDVHGAEYNCREGGGICKKIEMAPSQPPFLHLLQRLLLNRHRTVKILGV